MSKPLFILFLMVQAVVLHSQYVSPDIRQYSMEEGMPMRSVYGGCQDSSGIVWFSGNRGMVSYDGIRFKTYNPDSTNILSLYDNNSRQIMCDRQNSIWITGNGVECFDQTTNTFRYYRHDDRDSTSISNNASYAVYEDRSGNIWVGHWNGASKLDRKTGKFRNYRFQDKLFRCICEDREGNIWFGSFSDGVFRLDPRTEKFTHYPYIPSDKTSIGSYNVKDIKCDKSGRLWFASWGGGLKLYDPAHDNFITYSLVEPSSELHANNLDALCFDSKNNFWIGTDVGVYLFDPAIGRFTPVRTTVTENQQNGSFVVSGIFADNADGIWICSNDGIQYQNLIGNNFSNYLYERNKKEGLSEVDITGLFEGPGNSVYVAHNNSIDLWDRSSNRFIRKPSAYILFQDSKKRLWIKSENEIKATCPYDLDRIALRFPVDPKHSHAIPTTNVNNIAEDTAGNIYFQYLDYYFITKINLQTSEVSNIPITELTPKDWFRRDVKNIAIDADNNMWILYWGNYIRINLDTRKVKIFEPKKKGLSDYWEHTYIDSNKNFWMIFGAALQMYDKKADSFRLYKPEAGKTGALRSIVEDKCGQFWIPTNLGIACMDVQTGMFRSYTINDGLAGNRILPSVIYKNNELIVAHEKGVSVFNPTGLKKNKNVAPVVITHFRLFNKDVAIGPGLPLTQSIGTTKEIVLRYNQSVLSFEFSMLNYYHPEKNQYAYIMEGFEKEYNYVGNRNVANYTNLDPGEYTFRVKGANNDGVWNDTGTSIRIIILPPFWATWWFRLMLIIFIVAVIVVVFRVRMAVIRRQNEILEQQVKDRTHEIMLQNEEIAAQAEELKILNSTKDKFFSIIGHDLKNPFYAINGLAAILKEKDQEMPQEQRLEIVTMIEDSSKNASALLENLLTWARSQSAKIAFSPVSFSVAQVVNECFSLLQVNAEKKNIRLVSEVSAGAFVFADRNMITTVIRNLVNNALKFTGEGGTITVGCSTESGNCRIVVADTGVGMDESTLNKLFRIDENVTTKGTSGEGGTGLGLIICKEFADKNNGRISVESVVGKGSGFIVSLPIGEASHPKEDAEIFNQAKMIREAAKEVVQESELDKFEEEELKKFLQSVKREDNLILIIEDNTEIRMNLKQNLNQYFTIVEAEDGTTGIARAFEHIPDLVISDVMMPGVDGFAVCSALKSDMRTSHIPVILLTARSSEKSKLTGINMGADDYINKPFNPRLLIARIRNLILQRKQLRELFSKEFIVKPTDVMISSSEGDFLKSAIGIIEKNIDNIKYSVDDFSRDLGLSYIQLYRKLEAMSGQSPVQFIRSIRLKRASQLLLTTGRNINEVALSVGFNDASYFSKSFKEMFGVLPKQYVMQKKSEK